MLQTVLHAILLFIGFLVVQHAFVRLDIIKQAQMLSFVVFATIAVKPVQFPQQIVHLVSRHCSEPMTTTEIVHAKLDITKLLMSFALSVYFHAIHALMEQLVLHV